MFNKLIFDSLLPLLQWLDQRLEEVIAVVREGKNPELTTDLSIEIIPDSPLDWLQKNYQLSAFEIKIIAIAIASEFDRRYEQLYAYLQDDNSNKRPTVDLALNLLCYSTTEKLSQRAYFASNSPLLDYQLLYLIPPANHDTLLNQELQLDDQVIALLLGQSALDNRLRDYCQLIEPINRPNNLSLKIEIQQGLQQIISQYWIEKQPLKLYFQGADQIEKQQTAQWLASQAKAPLLIADLSLLIEAKVNWKTSLKLIVREAKFRHSWLYLEGIDTLIQAENKLANQSLVATLSDFEGIIILSGKQSWIYEKMSSLGIITIPFPFPNFEQRRICWLENLKTTDIIIDKKDLDYLSDRFQLLPSQIANVVITTANNLRWENACTINNSKTNNPSNLFKLLLAAARSHSGYQLTTLAEKIEPKYTWKDIILPVNQASQLREICNEAKYHHLVWETWGFGEKFSLGKGLNVLFSGSPGTGKTMAAEIIAKELQLDIYKIDLSQIVSKYIGETEKNLNLIFTAAANSNAILLFDEADALFGKRSEVQDAHDRYANIETSYLLQKIEEYEGIAILTTNFRSNMDEAFVRRLRFIIEFPLPGIKERRLIWQQILPDNTPKNPELDLEFLAENFELSGANIRNIALCAAFLAADDDGVIGMNHLLGALRRDYYKRGKILMTEQLGKYAELELMLE